MRKTSFVWVGVLLVPLSVMSIPTRAKSIAPSATQQQVQPEEKSKTFTGTVEKQGDDFVLSQSSDKVSYVLDDPEIASQYVGKKVEVMGTVVVRNRIHVETIQEVA